MIFTAKDVSDAAHYARVLINRGFSRTEAAETAALITGVDAYCILHRLPLR